MLVQFYNNPDGKSVDMLVDHQIMSVDIPYVPNRAVDHRGLALYLWTKENNVHVDDVEVEDDNIWDGYYYMLHPVYVLKAVNRTGKTKFFSL